MCILWNNTGENGVLKILHLGRMEEGPKIVTKAYDVTSWLLQQVNTFPRAYRFVLGDRIANTALDILEGLVEASHLRDKRAILHAVNLKLVLCQFLILGWPRINILVLPDRIAGATLILKRDRALA